MRRALIDRRTTETQITLALTLEGKGQYRVSSGIRFLDHMLELFARHGGFNLTVNATGDLDVDQHHTVEDLGIALGEAVAQALGDRRGINRAGYFVMTCASGSRPSRVCASTRPATLPGTPAERCPVRLRSAAPSAVSANMSSSWVSSSSNRRPNVR